MLIHPKLSRRQNRNSNKTALCGFQGECGNSPMSAFTSGPSPGTSARTEGRHGAAWEKATRQYLYQLEVGRDQVGPGLGDTTDLSGSNKEAHSASNNSLILFIEVSSYSPRWPRTCSVDQAGLEPRTWRDPSICLYLPGGGIKGTTQLQTFFFLVQGLSQRGRGFAFHYYRWLRTKEKPRKTLGIANSRASMLRPFCLDPLTFAPRRFPVSVRISPLPPLWRMGRGVRGVLSMEEGLTYRLQPTRSLIS